MSTSDAAPVFDKAAAKAELERLEDALLTYISSLKKQPGVDQRFLATAITDIQKGVMCAGQGFLRTRRRTERETCGFKGDFPHIKCVPSRGF